MKGHMVGRTQAAKPVYNDLYLGRPIGRDTYCKAFFKTLVERDIRVPFMWESGHSDVLFLAKMPRQRGDFTAPWAHCDSMQWEGSDRCWMLHMVRTSQVVNAVWELMFVLGYTRKAECKPNKKKQWRFFNPETQEVKLYYRHPNDLGTDDIKPHEWYSPPVPRGMCWLWLYDIRISYHTDETDVLQEWIVQSMNNLSCLNRRLFPCHAHWRDVYRESYWEPSAHSWVGSLKDQMDMPELPRRFQTLRAAQALEYAQYNQFFKRQGALPQGHEVVCDDCPWLRGAVHPETKEPVFGCDYAHKLTAEGNRLRPGYLLSRRCPRYMEHMMLADRSAT